MTAKIPTGCQRKFVLDEPVHVFVRNENRQYPVQPFIERMADSSRFYFSRCGDQCRCNGEGKCDRFQYCKDCFVKQGLIW